MLRCSVSPYCTSSGVPAGTSGASDAAVHNDESSSRAPFASRRPSADGTSATTQPLPLKPNSKPAARTPTARRPLSVTKCDEDAVAALGSGPRSSPARRSNVRVSEADKGCGAQMGSLAADLAATAGSAAALLHQLRRMCATVAVKRSHGVCVVKSNNSTAPSRSTDGDGCGDCDGVVVVEAIFLFWL